MREKKFGMGPGICAGVMLAMALLISHSVRAGQGTTPGHPKNGLYDSDTNHLWNRLHHALFVRRGIDRKEYGFQELEPLLWAHTKHLLEGPSHENAIKVLDEFLTSNGEALIRDPLKRAILQRDLWAVFDWTARWSGADGPDTKARQALQRRLTAVIARLALTKEEIEALPDNYEAAVKSHKFEKEYDTNNPAANFLPQDLFATNSPWVCIGNGSGEKMAPMHVIQTGGRSAFLVFMRTPGGREEATNYLKQFREFPRPYTYERDRFFTNNFTAVLSQDLPQFPAGTMFALVRQAILVSRAGELVPTHLTESVQLRRYNSTQHPSGEGSQSFQEFLLTRELLFGGKAGGLRAVGADEKTFLQFMDKGFDPFDETDRIEGALSEWKHEALDCRTCHGGRGVYSVNSFVQSFAERTAMLPSVQPVEARAQRDAARYWKQERFSWGLFRGLSEQQ